MQRAPADAPDPLLASAVCAALDARVRYALLRGNLGAHAGADGDIDLLVHPADAPWADEVLRSFEFVRLPRPESHFVRYEASVDRWLWFHVVHELAFGRARRVAAGAAEACLARCSGRSPARLAPADAFWCLFLHCVCDKQHVPANHRRTLETLATLDLETSPLLAFAAELCGTSGMGVTPRDLVEAIRRGDWSTVERLGMLASPSRPRHGRASWRHVPAGVMSVARSLWRHRRHHGLSVALLGPDGAGKSTLAQGIAGSFKLPVRVMYMGLTGGRLKQAARLRVPGVVYAARAIVIWERYARARVHQARGRLVVFDRYTLDAFVPHPRRLSGPERVSRWLDRFLCPLPDLVFVLDAPGALMHQRKGEYSAEQLEDWRQHFLALQHRIRQVEVIDATRDPDAVRIDATNRIWQRYRTRWSAS